MKNGYADIAQLVEQVIRNDQVLGSSPSIGLSINLELWLYVSVCSEVDILAKMICKREEKH